MLFLLLVESLEVKRLPTLQSKCKAALLALGSQVLRFRPAWKTHSALKGVYDFEFDEAFSVEGVILYKHILA